MENVKNITLKVMEPLEVKCFELILTNPEIHVITTWIPLIQISICLVNCPVNFVVFYYFTFLSKAHTTIVIFLLCFIVDSLILSIKL